MKTCFSLYILAAFLVFSAACDDFSWHGAKIDGDTDGDSDSIENRDSDSFEIPDGDYDIDREKDNYAEGDTEADAGFETELEAESDDDVESDRSEGDSELTDMDSDIPEREAESEQEDSDWNPEFVCAGGVCEDVETGFEWQENGAANPMTFDAAGSYCENLETDGGGWRLPNISELRTLVRNCPDIGTDGGCGVLDVCPPCGVESAERCLTATLCKGLNCSPSECSNDGGPDGCYSSPELGGTCQWFWSSSEEALSTCAFIVDFFKGEVDCYVKSSDSGYVRCVR